MLPYDQLTGLDHLKAIPTSLSGHILPFITDQITFTQARDFYAADKIWNKFKEAMRLEYLAGPHARRYVEASGHCQTFK